MSHSLPVQLLDVNREAGTFRVARKAFTDQQVFEAERAAIFDRCWIYLGHGSELPKKGAFVTRSVAGRNVLFNRDAGGTVRAFLNSCPHRGATVCRERSGNAKNF